MGTEIFQIGQRGAKKFKFFNFKFKFKSKFFSGIVGLIIGGLFVLYTQVTLTFISPAPFIPISTGIVFLIIWWQVKDVFCAVRIENYPR